MERGLGSLATTRLNFTLLKMEETKWVPCDLASVIWSPSLSCAPLFAECQSLTRLCSSVHLALSAVCFHASWSLCLEH